MSKFKFQDIYDELMVIKDNTNKDADAKTINCDMNLLSSLFTRYFTNIPFKITYLFKQECSKYQIRYIPKECKISALKPLKNCEQKHAKRVDKCQRNNLKYFKNVYDNSIEIDALTGTDIKNITNFLASGVKRLAIEDGVQLHSKINRLRKLRLELPFLLHRFRKHLGLGVRYLFYIVIMIFCLFSIFISLTSSESDSKLNYFTSKDEYYRILNNSKYRDYCRNITKNKKFGYKKYGLRYFEKVRYNLKGYKKRYIGKKLPKLEKRNIMISTINYGFLYSLSAYLIVAFLISCYVKIFILKYLNIKSFFVKMGKIFSVQIISSIGIYSIVVNFVVKDVFSEFGIISSVIFAIISIMCVAFSIYTYCKEIPQ